NSRVFLFFFSSRRRHTRSLRDWSSDVCSSDLLLLDLEHHLTRARPVRRGAPRRHAQDITPIVRRRTRGRETVPRYEEAVGHRPKIGRASCRERVEKQPGAGTAKKRKERLIKQA